MGEIFPENQCYKCWRNIAANNGNLMKDKMENTQKIVTENPDSITIGSATKGAQLKVYGDFSKLEEFKIKVDNSRAVRDYANQILNPQI